MKYNVEDLSSDDAIFVNENWEYRSEKSLDYIKWRIENGANALIRKKGEPVSWGLLHWNYSIGFLYTKKKYRRMGYAEDVLISLVNKVRQSGKIPYLYVITDNIKSQNLVKKIGFRVKGMYSWINIENM